MVGCRSCGESVQAEAQAKRERGEELTEDEKKVAEADDPNEALPKKFGFPVYGRLSPYDGTFCPLCEKVGFVLAIGITALLANFVFQPRFSGNEFWIATVLTGAVQLGMVLYTGRYLVLGVVGGAIVEPILASAGIYVTEKAKQEYKTENSEPDLVTESDLPDGDDVNELEDGTVEIVYDGDSIEKEQLVEELEKQKNLTKKERSRKSEYKAEMQEKDKELNQVRQEKNQKDEKLQKKEKQVQEKEDILNTLFGTYGRNRLTQGAIPLVGWDEEHNPIFKGFVVNTVWHKVSLDHYHGEYPNALIVDTLEKAKELSNIEGGVNDRIEGMDEFQKYAKYGRWLLDPTEIANFPKFENPERPGYPNTEPQTPIQARGQYPNVLFWNSAAGLRDARKEPDNDSERPKLPFYICAYDDNGNYVPPAFDPRGSEDRSELRDELRHHEQLLGNAHHSLEQIQKEYKKLRHEKTRLENQIEHQEALTIDARDNEKEALTQAQKLSRELETANTGLTYLENELGEMEDLQEETDKKRKQHRRDKVKESDSQHEQITTAEIRRETQESVNEAFYAIKGRGYMGNGQAIDLDAVEDGEADKSKEEVINTFLNDDDVSKRDREAVRELLPGATGNGGGR
jgi:acylphosphatase